MTEGHRTPKGGVPEYRRLLADNLAQLMRSAAMPALKTSKGLAQEAGVNRKTIDRMLRPELHPQSPNLDTVVAVFATLGLEPWEILLPRRKPRVLDDHQEAANNGSAKRTIGHKDKRFKGS